MFIRKVAKVLKSHKIPYAIVGGYAVALHGAVRGTLDIDLITAWSLQNLKKIEIAFKELGLTSRLPLTAQDLFTFKEEYIKNKHLIAWSFINENNPIEQIDLIITFNLHSKDIHQIKIQDQVVNVLSKKQLIKMKKISGRKQDLLDIKALEDLDE